MAVGQVRRVALAAYLLVLARVGDADPIRMTGLGAFCLSGPSPQGGCGAESTPIMWPPGPRAQLALFESSHWHVRWQAFEGKGNNTVLGLVRGIDGFPAQLMGIGYGAAMVAGDEVLWITGTSSNRSQVHVFWSRDPLLRPESWGHAVIHQFPPGWTVFNTSPAMGELGGKPVVVVAMELGTPAAVRGDGFASIFAVCEGCVAEKVPASSTIPGWQLLDPTTHIYTKARYAACPTLRWFAGYWYIVALFRGLPDPVGPNCNADGGPWGGCGAEHVARSKDLVHWEESPYGGTLMGLPDGRNTTGVDHHILPGSMLAIDGSKVDRQRVKDQTDDWNRSDMDMITMPDGRTYVIWMSGDQGHASPPRDPKVTIPSVAGIVNATEAQWLASYF
eukprot:SAG31_NODE_624_length_13465_cov_11.802708_4_plen_390_part_00